MDMIGRRRGRGRKKWSDVRGRRYIMREGRLTICIYNGKAGRHTAYCFECRMPNAECQTPPVAYTETSDTRTHRGDGTDGMHENKWKTVMYIQKRSGGDHEYHFTAFLSPHISLHQRPLSPSFHHFAFFNRLSLICCLKTYSASGQTMTTDPDFDSWGVPQSAKGAVRSFATAFSALCWPLCRCTMTWVSMPMTRSVS